MVSEDGLNHYTAIKSLSRLLKSTNTKHKCKQHFCMNCLQGFTQESSRDKHQVYCENNESVRVEMPKQGSTIEFKDRQNQFKVPFIMYADFESILELMGHVEPGSPIPLNVTMSHLTKKQWKKYKRSTKCHICYKPFTQTNLKVRDHCHHTGLYRGPPHSLCNLRYKIKSYIPAVFHNLSGYDAHLFIREYICPHI